MDEAILDETGEEVILGFLVFVIREGPVDFRIVGGLATGDVLAHEAEEDLSRQEMIFDPVDDALRVLDAAREYQVADDDAALQDTVITHDVGADLVVHAQDGFGGDS